MYSPIYQTGRQYQYSNLIDDSNDPNYRATVSTNTCMVNLCTQPSLEQVSLTINANGESDPLQLITYNDTDVFIYDSMKQKIWNNEYVDLALLLKQNFSPNSDCSGTPTVIVIYLISVYYRN